MPAKLNQTEILHGFLRTLVAGWGFVRVRDALDALEADPGGAPSAAAARKAHSDLQRGSAVALAESLDLPPERKALILALARSYDDETAFPTIGDARAFLLAHHRDARDIKTRPQAFKRILPLLTLMSEKGLEAVIARSRHSGPAELEAISKAIRGAGETMRGSPKPDSEVHPDKDTADTEPTLTETQEAASEQPVEATGSKSSTKREARKYRRKWSSARRPTA